MFGAGAGVVGCSASDPGASSGAGGFAGAAGGPPAQQMGNGFGNGGQGGVPTTIPSAGGAFGSGGVVGAGGSISGPGGISGLGGTSAGGTFGASGFFGAGGFVGMMGAGGTPVGVAGSQGGTVNSAGGMTGADPETGRLVGITAAHNAVRAAVMTTPSLQPFVWSETLAAYAQQWTDSLAMTSCASPHHRTEQELSQKGYGENLAAFSSSFGSSNAQQAVAGWAAEKMCWTFGTFDGTEKCDMTCYQKMNSDGCGHYTQIVWRKSMQLGCGVSSCQNGGFKTDIWICNYAPPGNYVGQNPY
jgi:pathogenesis-related protein 1